MRVQIQPEIQRELEYMVTLHHVCGAACPQPSIEQLANYVLSSLAEASRDPSSWARGALEELGLVADCRAHHVHREHYGSPTPGQGVTP